jgi:RNA polymerase sigma-70 factor (ECF subfamily)
MFRSVQNKISNVRKHNEIRRIHADYTHIHSAKHYSPETGTDAEIRQLADKAINDMPPKRRRVYELSRNEEMTYAQIAEKMDISVKTVEAHLSAALEHLRIYLKEYLPFVILVAHAVNLSVA